jgi:hypothetical protein
VLALILKTAAAASATISEETQAVYLEQLYAVDPAVLEPAVNRVIREWDKPCMMPPLAFILARCENRELAAEQAWALIDRIFRKHWHPDVGLYDAPQLDGATEYALRQIGGFTTMFNTVETKQSFLRRDFMAAHQRFNAEGGAQLRLSTELAERTLKALREGDIRLLQS